MPIATINPATGETLRTFDALTDTELDDKIAHAAKTFQTYRRIPLADRAAWLLRAAEILEAEQGALGRLMTTEMGKLVKAGGEEAAKCACSPTHRRRAPRRRASSAISRSVPSSR
jgi:succinate-semialdehyde dehydrogenase/glutarate-semialdehyde dehydrogenase